MLASVKYDRSFGIENGRLATESLENGLEQLEMYRNLICSFH